MRTTKFFLGLLLIVLGVWSVPGHAQTATATLVYDSSDTLANVQAYQTFVKVGSAAAAQVTPACVAKAQAPNLSTECSVPLAGVPAPGTQVTVTVSNTAGLAAATITAGGGPASLANVKITITVTVP